MGRILLVAALASGCAGSTFMGAGFADPEGSLRRQAAFDLDCPGPSLEIVELQSNEVYGVSGCSRRARYIASPTTPDVWVRQAQP